MTEKVNKRLIEITAYEEIGIGIHNPYAMWHPPGTILVYDEIEIVEDSVKAGG